MKKTAKIFGLMFLISCFCSVGLAQLSFTSNGTQTVNFSTTIPGVNNGIFDGSGFTPTPAAGQLDSDAFAITGFSDGSLAFGGTMTAGDFARGTTAGGVTTGGIFGYTTNPAIYIQPGGSDFTPGDITLRIQNNGASNIQQLTLSYDILVRNDQSRANSFNFSFSTDDVTYTPVPAVNFTSTEAADTSPTVTTVSRGPIVIGGLTIPPGGFFYLRWTGDDVSGAGSRDEFGLDNIQVTAQFDPSGPMPTSFQVINEIEVNNPGADIPNCHFIEIRGDANSAVAGNLFILEVDGDDTVTGQIKFARDLTGVTFGANGLITIIGAPPAPVSQKGLANGTSLSTCGSRDYTVDGTTLIQIPFLDFENGTTSFLLVSTQVSTITAGTDIDTDNNGTIDNLPVDATIVDAVGWEDSGGTDFVYGGVNITPGTGTPFAATRNFNNVMPLDSTAWFADILVGTSESVLYDQTNLLGGYMIDFITPGRQNLAPTAANGVISGKVVTEKGRGLKFVTLMLTGNGLPEPIYATTNLFGRYQFEDIPVGENYVLQVFSKRYTFEQPSMVLNLDNNISNADFIGSER